MSLNEFRLRVIFCVLLLSTPFFAGNGLAQDPDQITKAELKKLAEAKDFNSMMAVTEVWRTEMSAEVKRKLVIGLLRAFSSETELALGGAPQVVVFDRPPAKLAEPYVVISQDVYTEGGRAGWAIGRIFGRPGPLIRSKWTEEQKRDAHRAAYYVAIRSMELFIAPDGALKKLSVEERLMLAIGKKTPIGILAALGRDAVDSVRTEVAKNLSTPVITLVGMLDDSNPDIREFCLRNLESPRTVRNPYKYLPELEAKADLEIKGLVAATDFQQLVSMLKRWKSDSSQDLQKILLTVLLERLPSEKKLELKDMPADLTRNLILEGGRCAWAIELLLEIRGPLDFQGLDGIEKEKARTLACEFVLQNMRMSGEFRIEKTKLSESQRIRLGRLPITPIDILTVLSRDPAPQVRLAVAQNYVTPLDVLGKMTEDDNDARVREAAEKNRSLVR